MTPFVHRDAVAHTSRAQEEARRESARADALAARLRALGVDPDGL